MSRVLLSIGAVQVVVLLVALVRAKALSVLLGPADFGIAGTIDQLVLALVSLGALGVPLTALKFMARSHSDGPEAFRRSYAGFVRLLAALAAATALAALAVLAVRPAAFGAALLPHRGALALALLGVPPVMLQVLFVNALAAAQRGRAAAVVGLASAAALLLGAVAGALAGGVTGLYVGTAIGGLASTIAVAAYLRRTLGLAGGGSAAGVLRDLRREPEIRAFAALTYLAMAAYAVLMLASRYVVLDELGAVSAGLFQAVLGLSLAIGAVMTPMNNLYLAPLVNRRMPTAEKVAAADAFASRISLLLVVAALPAALFPRLVLTLLYSPAFAPAAAVLSAFVAWQCAYQVVNVYMQLLVGLDDMRFVCASTCAGFGIGAALLPALVPAGGLAGAAIALLAGVGVIGIASAVRLRRRFAAGVGRTVLVRAAFCVAAVVLAGALFREPDAERTLAGIAARAGYLLAATGALWMLLDSEERHGLAGAASRLLAARRAARVPTG